MLLPDRYQFRKWSLPAKYSAIGIPIGIVGIILTIYFGCWPSQNRELEYRELNNMAGIVMTRILEGSPLCCEIKTLETIVYLPMELQITLNARVLIGRIPNGTDLKGLSFAYSVDPIDTIKAFDCKMVGKTELNIFFFKNSKVFCSKPAILHLRDPDSFCDIPQNK